MANQLVPYYIVAKELLGAAQDIVMQLKQCLSLNTYDTNRLYKQEDDSLLEKQFKSNRTD